jgi:hypothetical protein
MLDDPELAGSLTSFYQYLRAEILRIQSSTESDEFMNLGLLVCQTRAAWQTKQSSGLSQAGTGGEPPSLAEGSRGSTSRLLVSA